MKDHPLQRLINFGVNDDEAWPDFIEGLLASCLLRGNALAELLTDNSGWLVGLRTLPWPQITPYVDETGILLFDFIPMLPPNAGQRRRLLRDDCLFVKDRSDSGVLGVSRLTRAAGALNIALELQTASSTFIANAARPGGALSTDKNISEENAKRMAQDFEMAYGGTERGKKIAVLQGGLVFNRFPLLTAEDAQIIAHKNFSVSNVCRIYSVPPWLLADPIRATP